MEEAGGLPRSVFRVFSNASNDDWLPFVDEELAENFAKDFHRSAHFLRHHHELLWAVVFGAVSSLIAAFGLSANGVANSFGVAVGSRTLKLKDALFTSLLFQLIAFVYVCLTTSTTEFHFTVELKTYRERRSHLLLGQLALISGLAASIVYTTWKKWPISTGHSVVGASLGFSLVLNGMHAVRWNQVLPIDFDLFDGVPFHFCLVTALMLAGVTALCVWFFVEPMLRTHIEYHELQNQRPISRDPPTIRINRFRVKKMLTALLRKFIHEQKKEREYAVEYQFGSICLFTAAFSAFLQSVQNLRQSLVPFATLLSVYRHERLMNAAPPSPLIVCFVLPGICLGIYVWGDRVVETIGKLAHLNAVSAFVAQLGTTTTVTFAHQFGIPVSTTSCLVSSVLIVGLANDADGVNFKKAKEVVLCWILALPATGLLVAVLSFFLHFAL
ncbi:Phosphate transporter [Aphelenchoides fujianensis]|nr:Phosphate transporter [Aphelenchoides fujianensis]